MLRLATLDPYLARVAIALPDGIVGICRMLEKRAIVTASFFNKGREAIKDWEITIVADIRADRRSNAKRFSRKTKTSFVYSSA